MEKTYINTLRTNYPKPAWSRNEKLAYWINLYNALTINLLLDNYPIQSITKIDKAWDTKILTIEGENYTLNDIENKETEDRIKKISEMQNREDKRWTELQEGYRYSLYNSLRKRKHLQPLLRL